MATLDTAGVVAAQEGRKYHETAAAYALPNDNFEHQRLEQQHELLSGLMGGKLVHAPISQSIAKALDIGCGTGAATHTIASAYPSTKVYGIDLSPVPGHLRTRLPNLSYIQGDFNAIANSKPPDQRFLPGSFDYLFSRLLTFGITDWQGYVDRTVALAKPGGWIEMQEADYHWYRAPLPGSPAAPPETFIAHDLPLSDPEGASHPSQAYRAMPFWSFMLGSLLAAKSLNPFAGSKIASHMLRAGLTDIRIRRYVSPTGAWPGLSPEAAAFGRYVNKHSPITYGPAMRKLGQETGHNKKEVEEGVRDVEREFSGPNGSRMWFWVYVICGRKPPTI